MARGSCHATSGLAWARGPSVRAAGLGLVMDVAHAPPPPAALYARVTHLSAPCTTSKAN
jgi:hypothetical protein